jgi:hypothetical protein
MPRQVAQGQHAGVSLPRTLCKTVPRRVHVAGMTTWTRDKSWRRQPGNHHGETRNPNEFADAVRADHGAALAIGKNLRRSAPPGARAIPRLQVSQLEMTISAASAHASSRNWIYRHMS